jgi:hypothetical protein
MSNLFTAVSVEQQAIVAGGFEIPSMSFATALAYGPGSVSSASANVESTPSYNYRPSYNYGKRNNRKNRRHRGFGHGNGCHS